ncbi:Pc12g02100 [Penicillium rubens Wisconsin 54-1255]|uniref:Pc12g02100 protein n=2 Tax=Penicillium chrysogenum species complex TaxID=254878 RepID=B6GZL8_PENRW|nr:Pc12g02100 [Penicillium rubens Wisconsin 54-1255]
MQLGTPAGIRFKATPLGWTNATVWELRADITRQTDGLCKPRSLVQTNKHININTTSAPIMLSRILMIESQHPKPPPFIFADTLWLGAPHDGYDLVPLQDYRALRLQSCTRQNSSPQSRAAMLQALLTFGLLEAVTETKVAECTLLHPLPSKENLEPRMVITSANIPRLLANWRSRIRSLASEAPDQATRWSCRVQTALKQALALLEAEVLRPGFSVFRAAGLDERDHAQILIQIGSLAEMVVSSSYVFPVNSPRQGFSWSFLLATTPVVKDEMVASGWCPFTIEVLSETVKMLAYARVCPPMVRESGSSTSTAHMHRQCSKKACVANNIPDSGAYEPRHVVSPCACRKLEAGKDVVDLLLDGRVPVIKTKPAMQDTHEPALCAADAASTTYIAISHVWADGLGSTAEAGIPSCQITRLSAMVQKIAPNSFTFWLDSLCVPARKDMRKKAIGLMAQTYRNASAVLVLDSTLQSTPLSAPRELKLLRVISSPWMQRLWTLQEAILSKEVIFAFADNQLAPLAELIPSGEDLLANAVAADLASEIFRLQKYKERILTLSDISSALRWRTSSKPADETLAIAGLFDTNDKVNAFTLAGLPAEKRMASFLLSLRHLPYNIIFLSGRKLTEPAFRWAPTTFMRAVESTLSFGLGHVTCTPSGLLAEYPVIYFPSTVMDNQSRWFIRDVARNRVYKAVDLYLGDEAEAIGAPVRYSCNIVLLMQVPRSYQMTYGVVAWGGTEPSVDVEGDEEQPRIVCEFRKRVLFQHVMESEMVGENAGPLVVQGKAGRMRVKVV